MTTFETNALEINDLNKNYPGFSLNHLNLTLPSGCILGLIGENGAGKTTTIKLILDIIKKDSGSIRILGRDCTSATTILKDWTHYEGYFPQLGSFSIRPISPKI